MAPHKKFYVVWKGLRSGIYDTWDKCAAQVNGYTGAEYMAFSNLKEAEAALAGKYKDYKNLSGSKPVQILMNLVDPPLMDSYCVDASCSGNPGLLEFRCVHTANRKELFHEGPFEEGTNNIGEFLAIVEALTILQAQNSGFPIYSDSENAILWVERKKCKTLLIENRHNRSLFEKIRRAEGWLRTQSFENRILKWDTKAWGEIPADFGRK
jgi:ribonuclease HI